MKELTYRAYLDDPAARATLEREVRRLRHEAFDEFIFAPAFELLDRVIKRLHLKPTPRALTRQT
ncbi:hypothetical protein [Variovorax sp. Sphag1AA]|uniref:hypothetical protein n=1 Tax=Variovorax sp. Sphag1AA TaxID=2587027 RepID=UPI0016072D24|nr:hypothetical protein [Variovorax sp. Sphag1AA]MBB3175678.1 hypothetical protein [Variovorax sp. Sphag1AA]